MITEDYVRFEVAKLLRDKGFDAKCRYYYIQTGEMFEVDTRFHTVLTTQELLNLQIVGEKEERCVAPTFQMAIKWFREIHKIFINIIYENDGVFTANIKAPYIGVDCMIDNKHNCWLTYEEAVEVAIKYCLENLI